MPHSVRSTISSGRLSPELDDCRKDRRGEHQDQPFKLVACQKASEMHDQNRNGQNVEQREKHQTTLSSLTPTGADIDAETVARIDAPSGSGWPFLFLETEIIGLAIPAAPAALKNPALDLVDFLTTKAAGGVALTKGTNLFVGFARRQDATPSPSVFALNTGGPPPLPYLNGGRRADVRAMVQVMVRSAVNDFETGETIAREVLAWLHQQTVPGYVAVLARDSQPAFLGEDSNNHYMWSLNLECQYVTELG